MHANVFLSIHFSRSLPQSVRLSLYVFIGTHLFYDNVQTERKAGAIKRERERERETMHAAELVESMVTQLPDPLLLLLLLLLLLMLLREKKRLARSHSLTLAFSLSLSLSVVVH